MMNIQRVFSLFCLILCGANASNVSVFQASEPCSFLETVNITGGFSDGTGKYYFNADVYEPGQWAEFDYVIQNVTTRVPAERHPRGCICKLRPCIRVCCSGTGSVCVKTSTLTFNNVEGGGDLTIDLTARDFGVLVGRPCWERYQLVPEEDDNDIWHFQQNGSIVVQGYQNRSFDASNYCFLQELNEQTEKYDTGVIMCIQPEVSSKDLRLAVYPIGMLISVPFLIITFLVYAFIPELRNLHGKCLMCYVFSLLLFYISLVLIHFDLEWMYADSFGCITLGYVSYISVFLCFFWLNVMCYDIWSTFRGNVRRGRGSDQKKFFYYSLYAFGMPLVIAFIVFSIDHYELVHEDYLPMFGQENCWIRNDRKIEMIYVYAPITIIIIVNILLYSWTAIKIFKVQKETSVIRNAESRKHSRNEADADRFFLYLRLFIIMGVTWSMESISWIFHDNRVIFYISDFLNCIQGLIIFMLFVWKPKIKQLILKRYRSLRANPPQQLANTNTTMTTTTSLTGTENVKLSAIPSEHNVNAENPLVKN